MLIEVPTAHAALGSKRREKSIHLAIFIAPEELRARIPEEHLRRLKITIHGQVHLGLERPADELVLARRLQGLQDFIPHRDQARPVIHAKP